MILVYAITLSASAGIAGLFARQALAEQGYVPGLTPGVMVACGVAATYAGLQLLYVGVVRFAWPTKTNWPLLGECLSHAAVFAFLPYLAHVKVHWPDASLEKVASVIYFAVFLGAHGTLKVVGFYAILRSPPGPRIWNAIWIGTAAPLLLAGYVMFNVWAGSVEKARPRAPEEIQSYRVGTTYATARALPEGSVLTANVNAATGASLVFACANAPDATPGDAPDVAYLTVELRGDTTEQFTGLVELDDDAWSYLEVPAEHVPHKLSSCQVRWSTEKESKWRRMVGILPVLSSDRTILVKGPDVCNVHNDDSMPNLVMIVVDGLGSDRVSSMGSASATTPNLDNFARSAMTYPYVFTPTPEAAAACMTLLTGVSPLRHGYLGGQNGPLPKDYKTLAEALRAERYVTAAFTEGEYWRDLAMGSGFERGFEVFDDGYTEVTSLTGDQSGTDSAPSDTGSQYTLQKARHWVDAHKDVQFMLFIRLGDLRDANIREQIGRRLLPDPTAATPSTIYNAVIQRLDRGIGGFISHVNGATPSKKTCIVVTSTRGSYLPDPIPLSDWGLRVPVVLSAPGVAPAKRNELAGLEDVASTLARMMHVTLNPYSSTADLINAPASREPISMVGNPLMLTIRNDKLRLVWSTQREPFTQKPVGPPAAASLYDLRRIRANEPLRDIASSNPQTTKNWTDKLEQYFMMQSEGWQAAAPH